MPTHFSMANESVHSLARGHMIRVWCMNSYCVILYNLFGLVFKTYIPIDSQNIKLLLLQIKTKYKKVQYIYSTLHYAVKQQVYAGEGQPDPTLWKK